MRNPINKLAGVLLLIPVFCVLGSGQQSVSAAEKAVYAVILRHMDRTYRKEHNGDAQHFLILEDLFRFEKRGPVRTGRKLTEAFPIKAGHSIVRKADIDKLISKGEAELSDAVAKARAESRPYPGDMCGGSVWKYFYSEYPGSSGYYRFSNIRFDRRKRRAQIEVEGIGAGWDSNESYRLIKGRRGWTIQSVGRGGSVC